MADFGGGNGGRFFEEDDVPDFRGPLRGIGKALGPIFGVVLVAAVALTSYYQIEPEEIGLVLRFGAYTSTAHPGLHFKLPLGIDQVIRVPVERQLKLEFGFRTARADVRTEYRSDEQTEREATMLTGDLNVANVQWIVQYKIRNPRKYVFKVRDAQTTLRDMSEAVMRTVVGDHSVSEVLTVGRESVQRIVKSELQQLCDRYDVGIEVLQLVLQDVNPPGPVRDSFNEVNQAIQERERSVNQAWARYNSVIPEARGRAQQTIEAAEGYAKERVNEARGDVAAFVAIETEYRKAPRVTRARLYLEKMAQVMPRARRRIFIDEHLKGLMPLLPLTEAGGKP